tara:strand:- start:73 stop:273 length:201 start_codon:yes stop_codon:yes gene_type:complete
MKNTCRYSFSDLFRAAGKTLNKTYFFSLPQEDINRYVKELCKIAKWQWEDRVGTDGVLYTAFAPAI